MCANEEIQYAKRTNVRLRKCDAETGTCNHAKYVSAFNFISRLLHCLLTDCSATTDEMLRLHCRLDVLHVAFSHLYPLDLLAVLAALVEVVAREVDCPFSQSPTSTTQHI